MGKNKALVEVRELEALCVAAGAIPDGDVRTTGEMREKAWRDYLECRRLYLRHLLAGRRGRR